MNENFPFVSVIIPCRNEEKFIRKCLDSLLAQNYPKESLEILVVDGASGDKTKEIIAGYAKIHFFIKILNNPQKFTPFGLNIGIKNSKGEIVVRMDAHAGYEKDYISKCVKNLQESGADNVGGIIKTLPAADTPEALAIAICLSHPFGAASAFRLGAGKPKWTDTVFGGCYWRKVFEKIGYFNEKLLRSQDFEFNKRLREAGGKILLVPNIVAIYHPQATLLGFLKHNLEDGFWVTYPLKFKIRYFSLRHLLPLIFVFGIFSLGLLSLILPVAYLLFVFLTFSYLFLAMLFSLSAARRRKNINLMSLVFWAFLARHFGYGLGSLWGLIRAI